MKILLIETATQICSAALEKDGKIITEIHSDEPNAQGTAYPLFWVKYNAAPRP